MTDQLSIGNELPIIEPTLRRVNNRMNFQFCTRETNYLFELYLRPISRADNVRKRNNKSRTRNERIFQKRSRWDLQRSSGQCDPHRKCLAFEQAENIVSFAIRANNKFKYSQHEVQRGQIKLQRGGNYYNFFVFLIQSCSLNIFFRCI